MAINPLEFNERAQFGTYETGINEINGNQTNVFVPAFSRWFGNQTQSLNKQYTLLGNKMTETRLIAIRHDTRITDQMSVKIGNDKYNIVLISPDNRIARETFDLITLQKVAK